MKNFIFIFTIYIGCLTSVNATGFGWYVSSFDWKDFIEKLQVLESETSKEQSDKLADLIITEITARYGIPEKKPTFSFLSVDESPMSSLEFYWEESLLYANNELIKKGYPNNYFTRFNTRKSSIPLPKQISDNYYAPAFFILSPEDIKKFYNQLKELSSKSAYPKSYTPYLLHLEGVLLKNSVSGERGLVFFGHD